MNKLMVGAGSAAIHFTEEMFPSIGEYYTFSHDDTQVQVLYLEAGKKYAIIALGLVGYAYAREIIGKVAEILGIDEANVILHIKHVLSTPHLGPHPKFNEITIEDIRERSDRPKDNPMSDEEAQGYVDRELMMIDVVNSAIYEAAEKAAKSIQPATVGVGVGYSEVNVNRLVKTNKGWWNGTNVGGPTDHSVYVIRFDGENGEPIAVLFNCNMAPGCLEGSFCADGGRGVSGDVAAYAERFISSQFGDNTAAIYTIGASANQWQAFRAIRDYVDKDGNQILTDLNEAGFLLAELLGERLGEQVVKTAMGIVTHELEGDIVYETFVNKYPAQKVKESSKREPVLSCEYVPNGECEAGCSVLAICDTALVLVGFEMSVETLNYIRERSPYANTFIMGFGNVPGGGYTAEEHLYDLVCYQSRRTRFAKGAFENFREDIVNFLKETHERHISK